MDKHKGTMDKRVRRHTWTESPEQTLNPSKKERHFSAPSAGASNEPDLLGSILSVMKSPKAEVSKWDGQPNYSELGGKKRETKWDHKVVNEKPHNQWWSTDPLQLESSSSAMMSKSNNNLSKSLTAEQLKPFQKLRKAEKSDGRNIERQKLQAKARSLDLNSNNDKKNDESSRDKRENERRPQVKEKIKKNNSKKENDSGLGNFDKKRFGISEKNKVKTSKSSNGRRAENTDKECKKNMGEKKKFSKEMGGTKSWRSKSSWKGAGKLGSTRKAWRPDRAYDFGRNHMEINDVETPNDDFELARIV